MMRRNRTLQRSFDRWLGDELAGRDARAERGLRRVFARLPMPAPSAEFADRVLARCGLTPAPKDLAGLRVRAAVVLASAGTLVAVLYLPSLLNALWLGIQAWNPLELAAAVMLSATQRLAEGVSFWRVLTNVVALIADALSSPAALATLAAACALSAAAIRLLQGLLVSERSAGYANLH